MPLFPAPRRAGFLLAAVLTLSAITTQASAMLLYVEPHTGLAAAEPAWSFTRLVLDVEPSDSIENVKAKIFDLNAALLVDRQLLSFAGNPLDDGRTLADYDIRKNQTLVLAALPSPGATAVPEPSSGWLVLLAGLGIAATQSLRRSR